MDSSAGDSASDILLDTIARTKRETVLVACQSCRKRKQKCNGHRPCQRCIRAGIPCVFESAENESPRQTQKRRFDQMSAELDIFKELYQCIGSLGEDRAIGVFRRIADGHAPAALLAELRNSQELTRPIDFPPQKHDFLLSLTQSVGSLDQILSIATTAFQAGSRFHYPSNETNRLFREGIITHEKLNAFLPIGTETTSYAALNPTILHTPDGTYDGPLHWVPAAPWVQAPISDDVVSHLVSLYLCFLNPYWRPIEEDVFLRDMRHHGEKPLFCSPFLVNAILSYASLFSEREEVFTISRELSDRGIQFHREAIRLWEEEQAHASITTVQGALVLSLSCGLRAKDRLGRKFVAAAVQMNKQLSDSAAASANPRHSKDYERIRQCVALAVAHADVSFNTSLLKPCSGSPFIMDETMPISEAMQAAITYLVPYPLGRAPIPFRPNLLIHHRSGLVRLLYELDTLFFQDSVRLSPSQIGATSKDIFRRLQHWYYSLPGGLRYARDMPASVYELHGQYYCVQLQLANLTFRALYGNEPGSPEAKHIEPSPEVVSDLDKNSLLYAKQAALAVRDYRETYGLKIILPYLLQGSALAAFTLLRHMKDRPEATSADDPAMRELDGAFEECFRVLLAGGFQMMQARGIMRMLCITAEAMKATLPAAIQEILALADGSVWQPADLYKIDSAYPNWAVACDHHGKRAGEFEMDQMLRKWEMLRREDSMEE